jgi:hypothetical protein
MCRFFNTNSFLPAIGRFLIVVTFIEDALRIITQWNDQLLYLHDYRHSTPPLPLSKHTLSPIPPAMANHHLAYLQSPPA